MFTTKNLPCIMDLDLVLSLDFNFKKWLFDIIFHKGRTDVSGGHTDYINQSRLGMYHYHHGIFPHLHPDSKCPYESEQTFIINPYNGKKVGIGPPYVFEDEKYYSVHLVTKALARIDSMGGLKSFSDNKGGTFYICSTGQSSIASFYEEFTFSYPRFLLMIKDNALFKTENEELQLLCHNKGLDGDSGYAYITLKELRRYMIKNGYFTDLCDDGKDVWSFKINFGIDIINPEKGTLLKVDNIVAVRATINNVAYAKLTIGKHTEFKNNLENHTEVVFSDYVIHNDDIGNLDIKVEVGMFVNLPLASQVVQIIVEGSGDVAITNDWLNLYSNPTVSGSGRSVTKHPNANNYDWGMPEELNIGMSDNLLPVNARNVTGKTPIKTTNNLYVDDTGRYWVAVGPNVMNPKYSNTSKVTDNDMQYGTKIDIHVVGQHDGIHYYIPAVIGDVKNHTYPDGLYQTGVEMVTQKVEVDNADGSTVEFLGYEILNKLGVYDPKGENSSLTITNDYKLIEIIVYDGVLNY